MEPDRRVNQSPRTINRLRRSVSSAAWTASWRIQQGWGWIGFGVLVLATLTGLGFAGYVFYHLLKG
jgi:hypothetical protein